MLPNRRDVVLGAVATAIAPGVKAQGRRNIVLIMADDMPMSAALNAMPKTMARSVPGGDFIFHTKAYCPETECDPDRASSWIKGQYAVNHGVLDNTGDRALDEINTVANVLHAAGYRTGLYGKYLQNWEAKTKAPHQPPGWDEWHCFSGVPGYKKFTLNDNGVLNNYDAYETDYLAAQAAAFVASSADQPFFLVLAPHNPHEGATAPARYAAAFKDVAIPHPANFCAIQENAPAWVKANAQLSPHVEDNVVRSVWKTVLAFDDAVMTTIAAIQAIRQMDNSLIIVATDQGIAIGEHNWVATRDYYQPTILSALWSHWPAGMTPPAPDALLSLLDIAPTFLQVAGVAPTWAMDGQPMTTLRRYALFHWVGGGTGGDGTNLPVPAFWGITDGTCKYIELATGERELYNLVADPDEMKNVAGQPAYAAIQASLAAQLVSMKPS